MGVTLLPGLVDAHAHVGGCFVKPTPAREAEPLRPGRSRVLGAELREVSAWASRQSLRSSVDDLVVEARQAMRYGAFDGPRVLNCCRIFLGDELGAGRFFAGMYREADSKESESPSDCCGTRARRDTRGTPRPDHEVPCVLLEKLGAYRADDDVRP